jgi:branched-subunit amino acid transport protein
VTPIWLAIGGMALVTYALRASFLLLPAGVQTPPLLRRALRFVPAAVLTAIWAPELLLQNQVLYVALENERLMAGIVAIAVAWRWRLTSLTIAAGLTALHLWALAAPHLLAWWK